MANQLIFLAIGILWFFLLICGCHMIATRHVHRDRSRVFFGIFAIASSFALLLKIILILQAKEMQDYYYVLPLRELVFGQLCRYLFVLYPIEVARPNWLTWRRYLWGFIPWLTYLALYGLLLGFHQTPLRTFSDYLLHLDQPDVLFRTGLLVFMLPFEFVWTLVYDPRHSSAGRRWLRLMTLFVSLIVLGFVGNTLTRSVAWRSFHAILYLSYTIYVMYIELFVRIPVPKHASHTPSPAAPLKQTEPAAPKQSEPVVPNPKADPLHLRIQQVMEQQALWREPELCLEDLARQVGSNRTYVTRAIQQLGYAGFKDYVNRLRVRHISQQLSLPQHDKIQALFFDAGYRSRGAAWRNFTTIVGCSPSEFEEKSKEFTKDNGL